MSGGFSESVVEDAALGWLEALGYAVLHGPDIAVGEPGAERSDPNYRDALLEGRLRQALVHLNPDLPPEALEDAYRKLTRVDAASLVERNRVVHRMIVNGVNVEYRRKDGSIAGSQARVSFAYFPALPTIDRRVRYSGEFVRWFLTENPYWVRRYRELLENAKKASRQRRRQWYEFGPPHTQPFIGAHRPKEEATLHVRDLATILRVSPGGLRRAARQPGFALPPKETKILAWTEEQVSRFLAPPNLSLLERRLRKDEADRLRSVAAKAAVSESSEPPP
jgi:hypothetical protein